MNGAERSWVGRVKAVIFDWAGTTVDYGSCAPADAFVELFKRHGVEVTIEQARIPMGVHKKEHIRQMLEMAGVIRAWRAVHGRGASAEDLETLYREFVPLQTEVIALHEEIIPGVVETVAALKAAGVRIGSTTGYTTEMMHGLVEQAACRGYAPDATVCADEVPAGRPAPWMALVAAMRMGVYPVSACVKVGDTVADIQEGLNAGMWTVGITKTGNEMGLSESAVAALAASDLECRLNAARERLARAGAHYVIEGVAELPPVIHEIAERMTG
jgi:phosphonoacetaldehyde hydrolase